MIRRNHVDVQFFNSKAKLPFELRLKDFELAMQDIYDFFYDVNTALIGKGLQRMDDMLRPAIMSGLLSDMLTASVARHSRALTENRYFNGHPDLIVKGVYAGDAIKSGSEGVEIKTTRKAGGAVDTHGARDQWMCVFVYMIDAESARRTRNKDCDAAQGRRRQVAVELDLQISGLKFREFGDRPAGKCEILGVAFDADTRVPNGFCGSQCRA